MSGGSNKSRAIITTYVIEFEYRKVNYFIDTVDPRLFDPWLSVPYYLEWYPENFKTSNVTDDIKRINFKKWNKDQISKKYGNKLEIKKHGSK